MANPHIITFIQGLSAIEIRMVEENLIRAQPLFENSGHISMELKLFQLITSRKKEKITDEFIINEIGVIRVTDLKNNLFSKVLEALTLDKYITNIDVFPENDIENFVLRKKLLVCKVALRSLNQDKTEAINELLSEIITRAKSFELYDILVDALNTQKYFVGFRKGLKDFDQTNNDLKHATVCYQALIEANDSYFKLILNNEFIKSLSQPELDVSLSESIRKMEQDYKITKSENINYFLSIMRFALAERQKKYDEALEYCNHLLTIIKKNKAIFRNERLGFVHDNLSLFNTYLKKYNEAIKNAKQAQRYYIENSINHAVSKEHEFYVNFYNKNYIAANKCLNELLSHSRIDTGEFRRSKYVYYRACVFFAEKDFKGALTLLNESLEIEKDKTRWNISLRILNIMIFIEMNKINEAGNSLESLRKYMERTGRTDEVSARNIMTVKLLREIEKDGFEYNPENKTVVKMIEELSAENSEVSLEYFSSELIPFHEWLASKKK